MGKGRADSAPAGDFRTRRNQRPEPKAEKKAEKMRWAGRLHGGAGNSVRHGVVRKAALWTNTNLRAKNAANHRDAWGSYSHVSPHSTGRLIPLKLVSKKR